MEKTSLSIIIVNYNTEELLKECLYSLQGAITHFNEKVEIIVIDNNSKDNSTKMLRSFFPQVILIENKLDLGFSKANNLGISKSKGEYILFLNPDTLVNEKEIFSVLIKEFKKDEKIAALTCRVVLPNGDLDDACHRGFPTPLNAFFHFTGISKLFPDIKYFSGYSLSYLDLLKTHEIDSCCGAFMLVRRKAGEDVGWWDEDYFWYGEDLDFCYKLKEKKWKILFVPNISIFHYKGASSGIKKHSKYLSKVDKQTREKIINARFDVMKIFYNKHYKGQYPKLLTHIVFLTVEIKRKISLLMA